MTGLFISCRLLGADVLGEWIRSKMHEATLVELRSMTKQQLRALWDNIGDDSFSGDYDCADIHRVMNEKGDGGYCAV